MSKFYNTVTAAAEIGCNKATISRRCKDLGLGTRLGSNLVLTAGDIAKLKKVIPAKPGNPNFVAGNYFGKPPKKTRKSR